MKGEPSCPVCQSPNTELLATAHRNDPLCKHFWRPSTLGEADTAQERGPADVRQLE